MQWLAHALAWLLLAAAAVLAVATSLGWLELRHKVSVRCLAGHAPVRVVDAMDTLPGGGIAYSIREWHVECRRCHKRLPDSAWRP